METLKATRITQNHLAWAVLAMAMAFSIFVRGRLADFPLERDEGEYAYAGQLILEGIPPYSMAYNMKLPGVYLAYAGLMAVFGQTAAGIHFGLLAVGLVTIVLIFFFAQELFDPLTGAVATLVFSILSTSPSVLGMAAHATHFMVLFSVAGTWAIWRAIRRDKPWLFFAAGLLFGLAFLTKQQGLFLPMFGGVAALVAYRQRGVFLRWRHLGLCLIYAVGAVLPLACVCLWLWHAGTFERFWFWTFDYARHYIDEVPLSRGVRYFWIGAQRVVVPNWPLWALAAVGAVRLAWWKGTPGCRAFFFGWLGCSFLCVCPGFFFRVHYFIVLLPCVAILAGVSSAALVEIAIRFGCKVIAPTAPAQSRPQRGKTPQAPAITVVGILRTAMALIVAGLAIFIVAAAIALPIGRQSNFYFFWSPQQACRDVYDSNPFIECPVIAEYIRTHSAPDDRVAVLGSEPEIFFHAGRKSATGYIYTYALMEEQAFSRKMQDEMIREIETTKPKFVVVVNVGYSWLIRPTSDTHIFDWMTDYVDAAYDPVGLIDITSLEHTDYYWDAKARRATPLSKSHLWVFRRRD